MAIKDHSMILALLQSFPAHPWRRRALAGLAALLLLASPLTPAAGDRPFGQGLLWRVERADAAPSHIFGTMHTADRQVVTLPRPVQDAFEAADSLVLEIVMSNRIRAELGQAMLLPRNRQLDAIVGPQRFARVLDAGARRYGMPREQLVRFKPWAVTLFFSLPPSELQRQAAGGTPLDQMLQMRARERGIALHGLETMAEQIAVLGDLSEPDQLLLLDAAIEANPRIEALFEAMKLAYLDRDLTALHRLTEEMSADGGQEIQQLYFERLIDARNQRMAARMVARLAEGKAFVALGALHLSGPRGVLKLLEQQGYTLTRVY
jgi:uncharacterized protein YbaP (TraB family)